MNRTSQSCFVTKKALLVSCNSKEVLRNITKYTKKRILQPLDKTARARYTRRIDSRNFILKSPRGTSTRRLWTTASRRWWKPGTQATWNATLWSNCKKHWTATRDERDRFVSRAASRFWSLEILAGSPPLSTGQGIERIVAMKMWLCMWVMIKHHPHHVFRAHRVGS